MSILLLHMYICIYIKLLAICLLFCEQTVDTYLYVFNRYEIDYLQYRIFEQVYVMLSSLYPSLIMKNYNN